MKRISVTAIIVLLLMALLASSVSQVQTGAAPAPAPPTGTHDQQAAAKEEPTLLAVADEYVKVVGGVVAALDLAWAKLQTRSKALALRRRRSGLS